MKPRDLRVQVKRGGPFTPALIPDQWLPVVIGDTAKAGEVITINGKYIVNPDPNMQRTGDEPV